MYGRRDNHSNGPGVRVNVTVVLAKDNRDSGDHRPVISEIPHHMGTDGWSRNGGFVQRPTGAKIQ